MKISRSRFKQSVTRLSSIKIQVIGDVILDEYLVGDVNRISPEAPVPVVWVKKESVTLGGSGNVVKNLSTLGVKSSVFARCGNDSKAELLKDLLLKENVSENNLHLLKSDKVPTTLKTRIIAGHQQVCRVDREEVIPIDENEMSKIIASIQSDLKDTDGIILSDYDKGYFSAKMIAEIVKMGKASGKFIAVDPQVSHFSFYTDVLVLTPNHHEAGRFLDKKLLTDEEIESGALQAIQRLHSDSIMITRGDKGMSLYLKSEKKIHHIPTVAREVFDVTGAGDTVISVYTAFKLCGLSEIESAVVSNAAASVVIARLGASTATPEEIENRLEEMNLFE